MTGDGPKGLLARLAKLRDVGLLSADDYDDLADELRRARGVPGLVAVREGSEAERERNVKVLLRYREGEITYRQALRELGVGPGRAHRPTHREILEVFLRVTQAGPASRRGVEDARGSRVPCVERGTPRVGSVPRRVRTLEPGPALSVDEGLDFVKRAFRLPSRDHARSLVTDARAALARSSDPDLERRAHDRMLAASCPVLSGGRRPKAVRESAMRKRE